MYIIKFIGYSIYPLIYLDFPIGDIVYILLFLSGISCIVYLFAYKPASVTNTDEENGTPYIRLFVTGAALTIGIFFTYLLLPGAYNMIVVPLIVVVSVGAYLYQVMPYLDKARHKTVWIVLAVFIATILLYALLLGKVGDWTIFTITCVIEIFENSCLVLLLALLLPVAYAAARNLAEGGTTTLPNKVADALFNFKGGITSRDYRAMLILLLAYTGTIFVFRLFRISQSVDNIFRLVSVFIIFYGSFAISIKRIRAKKLPIALGWIAGAITYLFFLLYINGFEFFLLSSFSSSYFTPLTVACVILIVVAGLLSITCEYDSEHTEYDTFGEYTPVTYLFKLFNFSIIIAVIRMFLTFVTDYRSSIILDIAFAIVCLGILMYYAYRRAEDAAISFWWYVGAVLLLVLSYVAYVYTDLPVFIYIAQAIMMLRIVFIALPSAKREF